ncbi:MAG: FtsX-like permease family protein, partial [Acidimicrobiia bacterium]
TYVIEALLPSFYLPGYGLRGVPLYILGDSNGYLREAYAEPQIGKADTFERIVGRVGDGSVAVSPPVAEFWRLSQGTPVLLGLDTERQPVTTPAAGTLFFLPGIPPRTVTDRQGYVQARVDYLNYLFSSNAYLVSAAESRRLGELQVLIPRVILLVNQEREVDAAAFQQALVRGLPFPPLEVHHVQQEIGKVATDMFIALALANMRIYLVGGLLLAVIAILAVALANYVEDRRTLALLRIRGASPGHMWRFLVSMLLSPALLGLVLGGATALVAGFGLANYVWTLREIQTVVQLLPTRLVVSPLTGWVMLVLIVLLVVVSSGFSWWVFRHTAYQRVQEG